VVPISESIVPLRSVLTDREKILRITYEISGNCRIIIIILQNTIPILYGPDFIIDDDPPMAEWVANLCRDRGHQPFPYDSSQAAIDALPSIAPQLVIAE
jgi:hypothetical protein